MFVLRKPWYTEIMVAGKWNEAKIRKLLNESTEAVERALVAIYERQTADEKATSDTRHNNSRGFSACHAKRGSYYARWIKSGKHLSGQHVQKGRAIALHYVSQLLDIAKSKAQGPAQTTFETKVQDYMRQTGEPRRNAESVVRNVMAGKCPDGCCGGEHAEDVERAMQRMEAEGDRAQTVREERAKFEARSRMEARCTKGILRDIPCFCAVCVSDGPDAPPPYGET